MSEKGYLQIKDAARWLGVTVSTIHAWIRRGHIREVERPATITVRCIPVGDLKKAFHVKCKQCGKTFKAKHPLKAAFCSVDHRNAWFREKALADAPRRRVRRPRRKVGGSKVKRAVVVK